LQDERHAREAYEDEQEIQRTGKPKIDYIEKEIREDGSERWVTTTKLPLFNPQGEVVGTFGISRDVTKIKMLEQERHEAELDKAVAQGKFELASDVMHDIGNAVVGFGSYLTRIRRLQTEDSADNLKNLASFFEKQKEAIATVIGTSKSEALINMLSSMSQTQKTNQEEINRSITEQLNIVTSIQEILHIQRQYITGHESQERKPVNMRNIINDSLSMVFASFDKMGIDVSLNMDAELPIIKGDRTKLMQLLLNVLRNSIEAIDINAVEKNIDISTFSHNDTLVLKIKDSGKGFDTDTAGKLFSKGFTTKSTASGLGLYSCRAIMESHEGTIQVKSTGQGKGAVTTLQFKI
jgi:signal transduction histidine kinase